MIKVTKRILSLLLCGLILVTLLPRVQLPAFASDSKTALYEGACGDDVYWQLDISGTLTISGSGAMWNYSKGSSPWYQYRSQITKGVIANGVTGICGFAFYYCSKLNSITIPESVIRIGEDAFYGCSGLKDVFISDLRAWCRIKFYNALSNPMYYLENLYLNNTPLTDLVIPGSVTSIGDYAFAGCRSFRSIKLPDSVTSIGVYAFYKCSNLSSITLSEGLTSIQDAVFFGCTRLSTITIPESVTSIGNYAFHSCSGLTGITIPENVTGIGVHAFAYCANLSNITLPESLGSLGKYAFAYCEKMISVTFLGSVPSGSDWFYMARSTVYYPCNDPLWSSSAKTIYGGTILWVADHSFGDYIPNDDVTCTKDGTATRTCSSCQNTETMTLPGTATGHAVQTLPGRPATCMQTGLTDGVKCAVCHEVLIAQETIPLAEHDYQITEVSATCTGYGYDFYQCRTCEDSFYNRVVAPLGHNYENGRCTLCGKTNPSVWDISGDGQLTVVDVAMLYAYVKETTLITDGETLKRADVTGDDVVNIGDVSALYICVTQAME